MSEFHHDHDQRERDIYNESMLETQKGCRDALRFAGIALLVALFLMYLISCKATYPPVTVATGTVISVEGDNVLVAFQVINKDKGSQGSNWFYCPKHFYKVGDWYPDPRKYSESW